MQKLTSEFCDTGRNIRFLSTDNKKKTINLRLWANDGHVAIECVTRGQYRIKIGFYYTINNVYETITGILEKEDRLDIPTGTNIGFPGDIDIMELYEIDNKEEDCNASQ